MKKLSILIGILLLIIGGIFILNDFFIDSVSKQHTDTDARNDGISYSTHYKHYILPSTLVFNLKEVPLDKAPADVFRVLLQSSEALKEKQFDYVELSYKGKTKFKLEGEYFSKLGKEYEFQNHMYTMRTFPENIMEVDGTKVYATWEGGMLGVLTKQMKDFEDFTKKWYLDEMTNSSF